MAAVERTEDSDPITNYNILFPRRYAERMARIRETGSPADLVEFYDEIEMTSRLQVHARLGELGLPLGLIAEWAEEAVVAELARSESREDWRDSWPGEFFCAARSTWLSSTEPASPEMSRFLAGLVLWGLSHEQAALVADVPVGWVEKVDAGLDEALRTVCREHRIGARFSEILQRTGVPRATADRWIRDYLRDEPRTNSREATAQRQQEVARFLAQGLSEREIADRLGVALYTVKNDKRRLRPRTEVRRRRAETARVERRKRKGPAA